MMNSKSFRESIILYFLTALVFLYNTNSLAHKLSHCGVALSTREIQSAAFFENNYQLLVATTTVSDLLVFEAESGKKLGNLKRDLNKIEAVDEKFRFFISLSDDGTATLDSFNNGNFRESIPLPSEAHLIKVFLAQDYIFAYRADKKIDIWRWSQNNQEAIFLKTITFSLAPRIHTSPEIDFTLLDRDKQYFVVVTNNGIIARFPVLSLIPNKGSYFPSDSYRFVEGGKNCSIETLKMSPKKENIFLTVTCNNKMRIHLFNKNTWKPISEVSSIPKEELFKVSNGAQWEQFFEQFKQDSNPVFIEFSRDERKALIKFENERTQIFFLE